MHHHKNRVTLFISSYFIITFFFIIQKPLFLLFQKEQSEAIILKDWIDVIIAGLPMDLSMAGYLMIIPGIILFISIFSIKYLKEVLNIYFLIVSILISIIFIPDLNLYSFWGFRIDSTVFSYIDSPKEVFASISIWEVIMFFVFTIVWSGIQFIMLRRFVVNRFPSKTSMRKLRTSILLTILLGFTFIFIRGGVTTSTMNPGYVYFSDNMFLNHTALNPVFNMFYSMKGGTDFQKQYRFMDDEVACGIFDNLMSKNDTITTPKVLTTNKPNIVFIILESFGRKIVEPLGGIEGVAPNLNKLAKEGVLFSNMYANSFRTDRGLVSVLAGYPAQPTMSILKYTKKVQSLNSIPKALINNGYKGSFLYGGDLNFAQMELFVVTQKITDITDDSDFPINQKLTKWGVPDAFTFDKFASDVQKEKQEPFIKTFLTLSSHEPFDVPTNRFSDPYLNSVFYTDSCLGLFIDKLKSTPQWEHTLVVLVPDHDMRFPKTVEHFVPERHDIFMLWSGGAIKQPLVVDKLCSQMDIASTLLSQLNINTDDFIFSKNVLNPSTNSFAFYTFSNGFGIVSDNGKVVFDCESKKTLLHEGTKTDTLLLQGQAVLQRLYDDIARR